jgi:hypothetical protein
VTRIKPPSFSLRDAMILLAATAVGFAASRDVIVVHSINSLEASQLAKRPQGAASFKNSAYYPSEGLQFILSLSSAFGQGSGLVAFWCQRLALWPSPTLAAWTVGIFLLTVLQARPLSRRARSSAGVVAGAAFILALAGTAAVFPQSLIERPGAATNISAFGNFWERLPDGRIPASAKAHEWGVYGRDWWVATCFSLPRTAAFAVAISWLALAVSGRWRMGAGWPGRAGVALGACWILLGFVRVVSSWLEIFVL